MASADNYDYLFKFIIVVDTGTGKSCLLRYFLEKKCKDDVVAVPLVFV